MSHQFYTLSVHDEDGQTIVVEEGHEEQGLYNIKKHTRLTAFFALCSNNPEARALTYDRLPYYYSYFFRFNKCNCDLLVGTSKSVNGLEGELLLLRTQQGRKCLSEYIPFHQNELSSTQSGFIS